MKCATLLTWLGLVLAACGPASLQSPATTSSPVTSPPAPTTSTCLPPDIELSSIVSAQSLGGGKIAKVTVQQKLDELGAQCQNGTLVDSAGKEIRFYQLAGCWGNPPPNYQDILQRQQQELEKLKEQYTVIEMTCNPSGLPIQ
jgi:hypothetical protein